MGADYRSQSSGHQAAGSLSQSCTAACHPNANSMPSPTLRKLSCALVLCFAIYYPEASAATDPHFACSGTLTIASESQDSVLEEPWAFSLTIDPDKNEVTINDTSIPII